MRKFTIARIHYSGIFDSLEWSKSILVDLHNLSELEEFIKSGEYYWSVSHAEQLELNSKKIVCARITKIKPVQELEVIDEVTKEESRTEILDVKEREGMVYIDIDSHLIAIETHGHLTKNQIEDVLIAGYKQLERLYEPTFDYTYNDDEIYERLKQFGAAKKAKFSLTTTNPRANDEFKPLDDHLRESNVQKTQFTFQPKPDGKLDITNSKSIVRQSLSMAAAGYGSGTIYGHDMEGRSMVLELGENLVDRVEIHESLNEEQVMRQIILKFKKKDRDND